MFSAIAFVFQILFFSCSFWQISFFNFTFVLSILRKHVSSICFSCFIFCVWFIFLFTTSFARFQRVLSHRMFAQLTCHHRIEKYIIIHCVYRTLYFVFLLSRFTKLIQVFQRYSVIITFLLLTHTHNDTANNTAIANQIYFGFTKMSTIWKWNGLEWVVGRCKKEQNKKLFQIRWYMVFLFWEVSSCGEYLTFIKFGILFPNGLK